MTSNLRGALMTSLAILAALSLSTASQAQTNVALAANGGVASASSIYGAGYPAASTINGDRRGLNWGSGGGWNDATSSVYPDWLQVNFSAAKTIAEIDVFTVQDAYTAPAVPTATMTFTKYGLVDFQVQTWNGSGWVTVPGGSVTGNNLVWRKFTFSPISTDRLRINITKSLGSYSRIAEVEAWTAGAANAPPTVALTAPANGASYSAPATVNLAANATDSDGSIAKVEFYRGSTLVATRGAAPYSASDAGLAAGSYSYTAKAYDNLGATTTSATVNVTVVGAVLRVLSVSLSGAGTGTVGSSPAGISCGTACIATYANGTSVTLTATPVGGASFAGWNGACAGTTPTCTVAMSQARAVGAVFALPTTTTYQYDPNGNLTQIADPLSNIRQMSYDALDRLYLVKEPSATTIGATQGQIAATYDGQDQVASIADPRNLATTYTVDGLGNLLTLASPDTGTASFTYDEAGNLKTRQDARGKLATYSYDALNRVTQIGYGDQTVTFTWDTCAHGKGRLCQIIDGSGTIVFAYDPPGRLTGRRQTLGAVTLATAHAYNGAGQPIGLTTPAGQSIAFDWAHGRISAIRINGATLLNGLQYQPFGPVAGWTWGNGQTATRRFDLAGRPTSLSLGNDPVTQTADRRGLGYDAAGRLRTVVAANDPTLGQLHAYDGLDRLTGTQLGSPVSSTLAFTYDLSGNRAAKTLNGATITHTTAATSNRLTALAGAQVKSFGYDNAGNLTSDGGNPYTYDNAGRRTGATVAGQAWTYAYNGLGQRVRKTGPTGTTLYAYDTEGHLLGEYDGTGRLIQETVWLGDLPVATLRYPAGTTSGPADIFQVHADHLDTPRRVTRPGDNTVLWQWESEPFGNSLPDQNPQGAGIFVYNLRFPGQVYDAETGLNYNYFRDYDPGTGRYVESDPIGLAGGVNTYSYVNGNPISLADPFGLKGEQPRSILPPGFVFPGDYGRPQKPEITITDIYGNWCGPDWTGGRAEQWSPHPDGYYRDAKDKLDNACRRHDVCYYRCRKDNPCSKSDRGQCFRECDRVLTQSAYGVGGFWGSVIGAAIDRPGDRDGGPDDANCCQGK